MADADGEIGDNRVRFHGSPAATWHPEREYVASTRPSSGMSSTRKAQSSHAPLVTLMMTSVPSNSYVPTPYGSVSRRPLGSNTNEPSAPIWFRIPGSGPPSTRQMPANVSGVTGIGSVVAGLPAGWAWARPEPFASARAPMPAMNVIRLMRIAESRAPRPNDTWL